MECLLTLIQQCQHILLLSKIANIIQMQSNIQLQSLLIYNLFASSLTVCAIVTITFWSITLFEHIYVNMYQTTDDRSLPTKRYNCFYMFCIGNCVFLLFLIVVCYDSLCILYSNQFSLSKLTMLSEITKCAHFTRPSANKMSFLKTTSKNQFSQYLP